MATVKKHFYASCFQFPNGRYLSYDENSKHTYNIYAENEDEAWIKVSELEQTDSEIPLRDRWNVSEIKK